MKVLIYNTKNKGGDNSDGNLMMSFRSDVAEKVISSRGSVVATFELKTIKEYVNGCQFFKSGLIGDYKDFEKILVPAYISEDQLFQYSEDLAFYAIEINDLKVLEETINLCEISPYALPKTMSKYLYPKFKAPQSMCRARYKGEEVIVLSNQPYWNARILSGDKTYEIRKYILDCMKQFIE